MHEPLPTSSTFAEPIPTSAVDQPASAQETALREAIEQTPRLTEAPRVWVSTTEDLNAGSLQGRWIAAARTFHDVEVDIQSVVDRSPYGRAHGAVPQWQVFAADGFGRYQPHPGAPLHVVVARANQASDEADAYATWARLGDDDPAHCLDFAQAYQGRFDSLRDFVVLHVERAGYDRLLDERLPAYLRPFVDINIDALEHELAASGDVKAIPNRKRGGVWVFTPNNAGKPVLSNG